MDGCTPAPFPILHPAGPIALAERDLLFTAIAVMLIMLIPVFVMAFLFAYRYRASGGRGAYRPEWNYSGKVDAIVWSVPALIVITLGYLLWTKTHTLDPYRPLESSMAPLRIDVIAQDWKWLFIYPDQDIASVNEMTIPRDRPISLRITSDTVMNSFYIPALSGQIYAMAGMQTRLHLITHETGCFRGRNMQYSGAGFPEQHFTVRALPPAGFRQWVDHVRTAPENLDQPTYQALATPSIAHSVSYYSRVTPNLFDTVIARYSGKQHK